MKSNEGTTLDGVTLTQGLVNLTTGAKKGINHAYCSAAGNLTITWLDGTTSVVACIVGESHPIAENKTVAVTTGTFHLSRD